MACKGLGKKGERLLRDWLDNDPALSVPGERSGEPEIQAAALGDCIGRRALVRYRAEDGTPGLLDLRVVSDDDTVYLFGLQAPEAQHESWRRWFDPAVGSFLPSVAQ